MTLNLNIPLNLKLLCAHPVAKILRKNKLFGLINTAHIV